MSDPTDVTPMNRHLDDGTLVRLLDRERVAWSDVAHLESCSSCQARSARLAGRSARFSAALASGIPDEAQPPTDLWARVQAAATLEPDAWQAGDGVRLDLDHARRRRHHSPTRASRGRPVATAAALAMLLFAGALTAQPVRQWLAAGIERAVSALRGDVDGGAEPTVESATTAVAVSFVPAVDRIEIRIDERQGEGAVAVLFEDRRDALGEVLTDDNDAALLVLPDGFRVRNDSGRTWSYRFRLPATLEGARVTVHGEVIADVAAADGNILLPLATAP